MRLGSTLVLLTVGQSTVETQGYCRWYPDDYCLVSKYSEVCFTKY